ncbi:MAG: hypothetical protein QOE98_1064 [Gaiellaceae bacterium]|jgi:polyhydroxyalkanoate synthesis regulator phasin|nr:hypothetical protein [Gaiellaceae bacterium]
MSTDLGRTAPTTGGTGAAAVDQAKEQVQEVAERAQVAVGEAAAKADVKVREQIDQRSTEAGSQLTAGADALRSTGEDLRTQGNAIAGQAAERVADQAHRLGSYLENADADQILVDVERVARRNPWAVVVGGVIVGAAASRFLKASSERRFDSSPERSATSARGDLRYEAPPQRSSLTSPELPRTGIR